MPKTSSSHLHIHGDTKELADKIAEQIARTLEKAPAVKQIRKSQVLSVMFGAIGFALFISGIEDLTRSIPPAASIIIGLLAMAASGALLRNLMR
jgi:hypothetical protein